MSNISQSVTSSHACVLCSACFCVDGGRTGLKEEEAERGVVAVPST